MSPEGVDIYVKWEAYNPMLSAKDRLSVGLIRWAVAHGKLQPGQGVVDVLKGSSGFGLALACMENNLPLVAVVDSSYEGDWRRLMRLMGTKVLVTDRPESTASRLAEKNGWFLCAEHRRDANPWIHEQTTGPEILEAMGQRPLSYFMAPHGTGGMLGGVGKVLRSRSPHTKICVVEQDSRPHPEYEASIGPHYSWPDELLRGWTTDFNPTDISRDLREAYVDETERVSGHEAMDVARTLAQTEGILTGISGGALAAGALRVARRAPPGSSVLAVLLDTSHVHLRTPLVQGSPSEMSDDEKQLLAQGSARSSKSSGELDGHF